MQVKIELDSELTDISVLIRAPELTDEVASLQRALQQALVRPITFYKGEDEYFIKLSEVLFFETDDGKVYAHTHAAAYEVKLKLYELEERLPRYYCRIAKSAIVNTRQIYALNKSFSGSSLIRFYDSHKQIYVSRHYYHMLKERISETR